MGGCSVESISGNICKASCPPNPSIVFHSFHVPIDVLVLDLPAKGRFEVPREDDTQVEEHRGNCPSLSMCNLS